MPATVTPAMRFNMHRLETAHRSVGDLDHARLYQLATYWESFPESYSPDQVAAACGLHVAAWEEDSVRITAALAEVWALRDQRRW